MRIEGCPILSGEACAGQESWSLFDVLDTLRRRMAGWTGFSIVDIQKAIWIQSGTASGDVWFMSRGEADALEKRKGREDN
jgi:hypothetical protein